MFLVRDTSTALKAIVLTSADPREDGFSGPVDEDVVLENDFQQIPLTVDLGATTPAIVLGASRNDSKRFRFFGSEDERKRNGYLSVEGFFPRRCFASWNEYCTWRGQHSQ
jgi:hypothetical protein